MDRKSKILVDNPEQIKIKHLYLIDEETNKIYKVDIVQICKEFANYGKKQEDLFGNEDKNKKINNTDYQGFLNYIRQVPTEKERVTYRGFTNLKNKLKNIRKFGLVLKNDENAFLKEVQIITDELQSLIDDIKQMKRYEADIVNAVYQDIIDLCGLLVKSSFYNLQEDEQTADLYYVQIIDRIRASVFKQNLHTDKIVVDKLITILDETQEMVWSCEIPNVCERWLKANPNLKYYDAVFNIYHNDYETYQRIVNGESNINFRFIPTKKELQDEQAYRSRMESRRKKLGETYEMQYQNEVMSTVDALFNSEFQRNF